MTESRLFQILYHLLGRGEATASDLAEKFEVSVRTIYRDIDKLSSAGIPVYTTAGYKGGIHLDEDFVLKKSVLSNEDMQNILTGVQSLSAAGVPQSDDCLSKLQGLFQIQDDHWLEVDYSPWGCSSGQEMKAFGLIRDALREKRRIRFEYCNAKGESGSRETCPLKLIYKDRAWYLQAYCLKRNARRLFRLSRMGSLELTEQYFDRKTAEKAFLQQTAFSETTPRETIRVVEMELSFSRKNAYRIFDSFDESMITVLEDRIIVKAAMPEDEWLYGFLMSFGDGLTVLSPVSLKEELVRRYKAALKHFED